jgi:membrane protease YdiL (CAAX protease family)
MSFAPPTAPAGGPWPTPPDPPELPDGAERTPSADAWPPWLAFVGFVAAFGAAMVMAFVVSLVAIAFGADLDDTPAAVSIVATYFQDIILIAAAFFFARSASGRTIRLGDLGLRRIPLGTAVAYVAVAYVAFIAFSAGWVAALGLDETDNLPQELGVDESTVALIAVCFLVVVMAPIGEELFFRGFFYRALRNWKGMWPAAIITGVVFGGIHAGSSPIGYLVPLAVLGIGLCLLYQWSGSLYPPIALHAINNSIAFGVSVGWDWQILPTAAGSLLVIAMLARLTEVKLGDRRDLPVGGSPA